MPAAAVIPAPLAYIKVVAVKTFEVDTPSRLASVAGARPLGWDRPCTRSRLRLTMGYLGVLLRDGSGLVAATSSVKVLFDPASWCPGTLVYLEQIRVLKAG